MTLNISNSISDIISSSKNNIPEIKSFNQTSFTSYIIFNKLVTRLILREIFLNYLKLQKKDKKHNLNKYKFSYM